MKIFKAQTNGSILLPLIIVLPFLMLIAGSYMNSTVTGFRLARGDQLHTHAQLGADAGADYATREVNQTLGWTGTSGEVELINEADNRVTYEVTVTDNNPSSKTITSTGRSYRPATATTPTSSVIIKVNMHPVESGSYSVVSGQGGLIMSNSAKIVGGDVFVNGEISLSNSAQIGLSTNFVNVEVANQVCPTSGGPTYPRLCNAGENDNPITIQNTAHIYGSVKANHQSSGSGMSNPGLTASSGVAVRPLPTHDRASQKAAVASTTSGSSASCAGSESRTWAANIKIIGDVSVKNSCVVTVQGDVWITGKLEVENTTQIKVADSLGAIRPNIMVDGQNVKLKNSAKLVSNASATGFQVITYFSKANCSPDCADVTGQDLYDSRGEATIELDNSAEGPQSIFYARWTRVLIANSGQIGALVGQTVELKNTGTITFGSSTGGSSTNWVVDGYRRDF